MTAILDADAQADTREATTMTIDDEAGQALAMAAIMATRKWWPAYAPELDAWRLSTAPACGAGPPLAWRLAQAAPDPITCIIEANAWCEEHGSDGA